MKKILILALILSALLCMNVFAAEIGTITDPVTGDPIAAEKATILEKEVAGEQQKVAVKFTQSGVTKDNMYLVLILAADANGEAPLRPTDSNILYVNQATAESDTITFDNLYPSEVKESYIFLAGADVDYSKPLAKINPLKPAGVEVSGQVISYLAADGEVTIELFKEGAETAAYTTKTTTGKYNLTGVEAATYTIYISKAGHATHSEVINVEDGLEKDITIYMLGDVNMSGSITVTDANWIRQNVVKMRDFTEQQLNIADVNNSGGVTVTDANWTRQRVVKIRDDYYEMVK